MSFSTGCRKCKKCGKMYLINLFDGGLCAECEKDMPCITPEEMQKCKDVVKKYTPKQEPCDDVVSRQAVIEICNEEWDSDLLVERIEQLPPVRPQEQTGHWISHYDEDAKEGWYECDRCHTERAFNNDYCPDCGARMVEESEDKE